MRPIQKKNKNYSFIFKLITFSFLLVISGVIFFSVIFLETSKREIVVLERSEELAKPSCYQKGGFYNQPVAVFLHSDSPDAVIYYSLDGSSPDLSSMIYKDPIVIVDQKTNTDNLSNIPTSPRWKPPLGNGPRGVILKAIVVDKKNRKSKELVRTFFIRQKHHSFPVVALTVNVKDFFGHKNGIYILGKNYEDKDNYIRKNIPLNLPWWEYPSNYLSRGIDSERKIHIEFFENIEENGFYANAGVRINGNATRGYAQKSLRIYFNKKYGNDVLKYDLFKEGEENTYNCFVLRNSGNDWDKTMFRDGLMQSLMKNTHVEIQKNRDAIVYLNGEYWGIHNIREHFDENYLVNKYHIPADSVAILELNGILSYGKETDRDDFTKLLNFVKKNDLSDDKNYKYVLSKIDVKSFTDFLIANIYFCNSDWPNNNVKFWHYKGKIHSQTNGNVRDGRWRWMLYDMDWGFGYNTISTPDINLLPKAKATGSVGVLFSSLIKNKLFVNQFVTRYKYLMNTVFAPEYLLQKIDRTQKLFDPEIEAHINRWRVIGSYESWRDNVDVLRDFAVKRRKFQIEQINDFFKLKDKDRIDL